MPRRNKRKRPVKAEPPGSDSEYEPTIEEEAPPKRVKAEVKSEVKAEQLSDDDFAIVLSDYELSDSSDQQVGQPVRRSAGGRPPRRGVDVSSLYEEAGDEQLARSLGQVVKEERAVAAAGTDDVEVEDGSGNPLRVSDYVRRAAAVRAQQILLGDKIDKRGALAASEIADIEPRRKRKGRRGYSLFTEEQREFLRAQFELEPYPDRATKEELSEQFGVEYKSVDYWFNDERQRKGTVRSNYDSARKMCVFGPAVYDELVAVFERNQRPDLATRKAFAAKAGASVKQINSWFHKRRKQQIDSPRKVEITPTLRMELEAVFNTDPYPDRETRAMLAEKIGCSMQQITRWFNSRRRMTGMSGSKADHARRVCPFGPEGYDKLVAQFESDPYPDRETRATIATGFGGTVEQVSNWFQARRVSEGIASRAHQARLQCAVGPAAYDELVAVFEADPFPDRKTREALAAKTGGTLKQITNWFRGRRLKEAIRPRSDARARSKFKFGGHVYDELVAQFEAEPFPNSATVKMLAHKAGGTPKQISNWFFGRRKRFGIQRSNEEWSRQRCKFGPEVYDQLVAQFEADPYPSTDIIEELAERAEATAAQIYSWFDHRRSSRRRRQKEVVHV